MKSSSTQRGFKKFGIRFVVMGTGLLNGQLLYNTLEGNPVNLFTYTANALLLLGLSLLWLARRSSKG